MKEKEIIDFLFNHFETHKYMLGNSYVYRWESDFFSQLKSGYHQEVEVKTSRSDFFADFKKEDKHRVLQQRFNKQELITYKGRTDYKIKYWTKEYLKDENRRRVWDEENGGYKFTRGKISERIGIEHSSEDVIESIPFQSKVWFRDPHSPNRFYYCCPDGLILAEEVPEYAGLLYCRNGRVVKIKNAPLIHKQKRNLSQILLDKFYHKYLYSR